MEKIVVSVDKTLNSTKLKNLFYSVIAINGTWMLFHFTVVFFFTLQLKSVVLVGIFLGLGNFFSFIIDIPIGIIQNYFKAKTLYFIAAISQIAAMIIFANFIFQITNFLTNPLIENAGVLKTTLGFFLGSGLNIFLMLLASFCYGLTKEIQDITIISYILNNTSPNQYANILAKINIASGIGSLFGLLSSGIILSFAPDMIVFSVILIIFSIIYFTNHYFDNGDETLDIKDVYKFKVLFDKTNYENIGNNLKKRVEQSVNKVELIKLMEKTKFLFIKPTKIKKGLSFDYFWEETRKTFILTYNVIINQDKNLLIYWSIIMLLTFGFRDTFASTFLINYLDNIWKGGSYILLGIIAIPAFGLQSVFGNIAEKYGNYLIANIGLALSGFSLFFMGFFSDAGISTVMILALINSIGYASCMGLSQASFLETYNKSYAEYKNLEEIDANASAAPMKILQNLANVFGLVFGGLILAIFNYMGFFFVFGIFIIGFLIWSLKNKNLIKK